MDNVASHKKAIHAEAGSSTLRHSIGAIVKSNLSPAISRGAENDTKRFDNYKFKEEESLTARMKSES